MKSSAATQEITEMQQTESQTTSSNRPVVGRFAPSPSGRMHMGNIVAALASWLSARRASGRWVLRIEDLDPQRSKMSFARQIEDDLRWLGLDWDEGGIDARGPRGPYLQSLRSDRYLAALDRLAEAGLTYTCHCTRADIMATQAPHQSDGRIVYSGTCRPMRLGGSRPDHDPLPGATRIFVPDHEITFTDRTFGPQRVNLARHCGDFVLRRADGAWAYQLAVVVDDAEMGITEVVRGEDLLLSSAQQIYLFDLLGYQPPQYAHIPLVTNAEGLRLSKRDQSMSMEALRALHTPAEVLGRAAALLGLIPEPRPLSLTELI